MELRFGPDDEDAFYAARDDLVSCFEQTSGGHGLGWVAEQVLDFKWGYLDGDLSRWVPADVEEILLGLYPAKVMLGPDDLDQVVTGFTCLLQFLGDEGILAGSSAVRLGKSVKRLASRFHAAALDDRNWSMGKRLWSFAQSEGVDSSDLDAMQRFIDEFNQRPLSEREAVLGPHLAPDDSSRGSTFFGSLPPIVLPPAEELESAAEATVAFRRIRRLVGYVGEGRALTDKGNLKLVDGKTLVDLLETRDRFDEQIGDRVFKTKSSADLGEVDLTFRMAVESKMLKRKGKKLLPGPNAKWVDDPLSALYGAWLVLLNRIGPTQHFYRGHHYNWDWYAKELDSSLPMILVETYSQGDSQIEDIFDDMWAHLLNVFELDEVPADKLAFHRRLVENSLRRAFGVLEELGTVAVGGVTEVSTEYGGIDRTGGVIKLTPLGKWAVQRMVSRVASAPIVGALRESSAAELLTAASDLPEAKANAEIDAWIDFHGDDGAPLLVEALRNADETGRGLGFQALLRVGPEAENAVTRLGDDPELAAFATVWRIDTLTGSPEDMDCGGDPERFVRLLGAVIELWGPEAALSGWAEPAAGTDGLVTMLDQTWRVKRPETEQVLATIGSGHPDKPIARAARKALFKYRSAG